MRKRKATQTELQWGRRRAPERTPLRDEDCGGPHGRLPACCIPPLRCASSSISSLRRLWPQSPLLPPPPPARADHPDPGVAIVSDQQTAPVVVSDRAVPSVTAALALDCTTPGSLIVRRRIRDPGFLPPGSCGQVSRGCDGLFLTHPNWQQHQAIKYNRNLLCRPTPPHSLQRPLPIALQPQHCTPRLHCCCIPPTFVSNFDPEMIGLTSLLN